MQLIIIFLLINNLTSAQSQDYKLMRDSLSKLSCEPVDSATFYQAKVNMETFDTNLISKSIQLYYRDLAWCYYRIYMKTENLEYIKAAIGMFEKALPHKSDYTAVLWDISFCHYILGNCKESKFYLKGYKKITPKKYWDKTLLRQMLKK